MENKEKNYLDSDTSSLSGVRTETSITSREDSRENSQQKNNLGGKKQPSFFVEIIKFSLLAILIVAPIRLFIAQPFIVSGASMEPTFHNGEYLIVDQISYAFETPERGDVIIFKYPKDPSKFFIKRIIGLPGETIELRKQDIIIRNQQSTEEFILGEPYLSNQKKRDSNDRVKLENDEYYVLGDNRDKSSDSRIWGPLEEGFIVGRAFLRVFPIGKSGLHPGSIINESEE